MEGFVQKQVQKYVLLQFCNSLNPAILLHAKGIIYLPRDEPANLHLTILALLHSGSKPDLQGSSSHSLLHHAENAIPPLLGDYDPFSVAQNPVEVMTVMLVS
jgi:hypothetical protein